MLLRNLLGSGSDLKITPNNLLKVSIGNSIDGDKSAFNFPFEEAIYAPRTSNDSLPFLQWEKSITNNFSIRQNDLG